MDRLERRFEVELRRFEDCGSLGERVRWRPWRARSLLVAVDANGTHFAPAGEPPAAGGALSNRRSEASRRSSRKRGLRSAVWRLGSAAGRDRRYRRGRPAVTGCAWRNSLRASARPQGLERVSSARASARVATPDAARCRSSLQTRWCAGNAVGAGGNRAGPQRASQQGASEDARLATRGWRRGSRDELTSGRHRDHRSRDRGDAPRRNRRGGIVNIPRAACARAWWSTATHRRLHQARRGRGGAEADCEITSVSHHCPAATSGLQLHGVVAVKDRGRGKRREAPCRAAKAVASRWIAEVIHVIPQEFITTP